MRRKGGRDSCTGDLVAPACLQLSLMRSSPIQGTCGNEEKDSTTADEYPCKNTTEHEELDQFDSTG